MEKHLRFRKGDLLAAALVLLAAVLVFLCFLPGEEDGAYAQVYRKGELIRTIPLDQEGEYVIEGEYRNTLTVSGGKIAVTATDCPGEDCVGCGWIGTDRRSIVCLPNGVEIRVISGESDVDFAVG